MYRTAGIFSITCLTALSSFGAAHPEPRFLDTLTVSQTTIAQGKRRSNLCPVAGSESLFLLPSSAIEKLTELLDETEYDRLKLKFNLRSAQDLERLKNEIKIIRNLTSGDLRVKISEESLYAYAEMYNLASLALDSRTVKSDYEAALVQLQTLAFAANSQFIYPIPKSTWLLKALMLQANRGAFYATPPCDVPSGAEDEGRQSPPDSLLWKNPGPIGVRDLSVSAGRAERLTLQNTNCLYDRKHKGFGIHAGFYVKCFDGAGKPVYADSRIKIKFGNETHSGPFNSRIYTALGYRAQQSDYFSSLKVKYDRRIFTESNSSKKLEAEVWSMLFGTVANIRLSGGLNPFTNVEAAVLKNGERLTAQELTQRLLVNSAQLNENILAYNYDQIKNEKNFSTQFESQIDHLVMRAGSFSLKKNKDSIELGAWAYNDPVQASRRDMRGLIVLSAFLGNYDIRWDNTALEMVKTAQGYELRQSLSDVGSGLGQAANLRFTNADSTAFPKRWIHAGPRGSAYDSNNPFDHDPAVEANGFRFLNYQPNLPNRTFEYISRSDAQWMARLIAQLRPEQLRTALVASGFSPVETEKFVGILVARQKNLIEALKLR